MQDRPASTSYNRDYDTSLPRRDYDFTTMAEKMEEDLIQMAAFFDAEAEANKYAKGCAVKMLI